ncbi:hypothetical protein ITP53_08885 [Nonomuraea sp. K274]|uniref:LigA protein n=1 Tax=Nonomuraea cypriaca TaxID=1187855 RepID=A0A931EX48_9ACTN|nr:hypothetical protein [Nonomuraea cypriaca]MBF8185855.1 hypothetical protein [Nonomuraea cypriaca]
MTRQRAGIGRVTAAIVTAAAMLPYLTLKILWLTGSSVGVDDPALMSDPAMIGANAATFGMEAVGLALTLALTTRLSMRLPAWLVLLPLWVGIGLLSEIVVTLPLSTLVYGPTLFSAAAGPIQPWVYLMVYGGFIVQGVGLMTVFALHARERWPGVFTTRVDHAFASPTRSFQTVVARGAFLVAALVGGVRIYWAAGGTAGVPAATSLTAGIQNGFKGVLAIAGAAALVALVSRRGRGPFWRPLVVAWLGSGSMFGFGFYSTITAATVDQLGAISGAVRLVDLFGMLTGLVMGMCGAFLLAERSGVGGGVRAGVGSGVGDVQPAQEALEADDRDGDRQTADHSHP